MINRHLYKTVSYNRKIGTLNKQDFLYIRDLLEKQLVALQESDADHDLEITELKLFFIRFDHHIQMMKSVEFPHNVDYVHSHTRQRE